MCDCASPSGDAKSKANEALFGPVFEGLVGRYRLIAGAAIVYFVVCFTCCVWGKHFLLTKFPCFPWHLFKLIAVFSWVIGPPAWFYFEYAFLVGRRKFGWKNPISAERYKFTQDLLAKLWVALAATLAYAAGLKP